MWLQQRKKNDIRQQTNGQHVENRTWNSSVGGQHAVFGDNFTITTNNIHSIFYSKQQQQEKLISTWLYKNNNAES